MIGIIAVPFFDTPENRRGEITRSVLCSLYYDLDCRHIIIPVDNGSTDLTTWNWISACSWFPHAILQPTQSVAHAVNAAWHLFEGNLLRGEAIAVKCDSDWALRSTVGSGRDWLEHIIEIFECPDPPGLLGPRLLGELDWSTGDTRVGWMPTTFVRGTVVARSPECFQAIGYCRHPGDVMWGWQDHWDCFRAQQAGFEIGVLSTSTIYLPQEWPSAALPEDERTRLRAEGRVAYIQWQAEVRRGERSVYEE